MNILLYLSDMEKGGAQRVISNLANSLVEKNEVTLLTTFSSKLYYSLDKRIKVENLNYKPNLSNKFNKNLSILKHLIKLKNTIKNIKPDIILTFLTFEINSILSIKPFIKSKVIVSFRNDPNKVYISRVRKLRINVLLKKADGIVYQTKEAQSFFNSKLNNKSNIIMNPINKEFLLPAYKGLRQKKIVAVGKLTEQKNHKMLVDAFSKISNKFPQHNLYIYGEGVLRSSLEKQIKDLGLGNRVFLPGSQDQIIDEIYDAALFVLSSDYEGISNALLEALALGIPVISTDCPCGGSKEVISNGQNGILTPVGDTELLSKSMETVLSSKDLSDKLSENASMIKLRIDPDKINQEWEEFIIKTLER